MSTNQNKNSKHSFFMTLALMQAQKNLGMTKENPSVGCVIVKNNHIISAGHTGKNGRPHAEHNAISYSKNPVKNSDLYVTLEPCSHYGKTPPCVKTIIRSKIKRVFFSLRDPDIRSYNKSTQKLKKNNIIVQSGTSKLDMENFYKSYFKLKKGIFPFVTAKIAISKDFYTKSNKEKWITNKYSRARVHLMRSHHDCILTSANTIIDDNPRLTCRIPGLEENSPSRIILDKELKIPIKSNVIRFANKYRTIIFFNKNDPKKIKRLKSLNIELVKTPLNNGENFDLRNILIKVKLLGFSRIFLESGLNLTTNFLIKNLVDDFQLFISSKNLGKNGKKSFKKNMKLLLKNKRFVNRKVHLFGDKLISYNFK